MTINTRHCTNDAYSNQNTTAGNTYCMLSAIDDVIEFSKQPCHRYYYSTIQMRKQHWRGDSDILRMEKNPILCCFSEMGRKINHRHIEKEKWDLIITNEVKIFRESVINIVSRSPKPSPLQVHHALWFIGCSSHE